MAQIIAVLNQKGGVGKTTTAINVATYLGKTRKNILLIDADPQGNATSGLGVAKQELGVSLYHVLLGQATVDQAITDTDVENVRLLPANADLAAAEVELVGSQQRESVLKN